MNSRPGRHLFDPAITAAPCKYPCEVPTHVHDSELPSNLGYLNDFDPERLAPFRRSSTHLEVDD